MAHYKLDTNMAGAFLNMYMPIGEDNIVKCLERDYDLYENRAYVLRACEYCRQTDNTHEYSTLDDMMLEAQAHITKLRAMFTDEKLEKIYSEHKEGWLKECILTVNETMVGDGATPDVAIKRADSIWRLFASRHPEIKLDGFANVLLAACKTDEERNVVKRTLNMK